MAQRLKPKLVHDIQTANRSVFHAPGHRLNLGYEKTWRLPATTALKAAAVFAALWLLIIGSASAPTTQTLAANTTPTTNEERQQLESQLKELENQIDQYETQVEGYRKQGSTLKGEIKRLNDKITKLNLQVKAINLQVVQLDKKIAETQEQITDTEGNIARHTSALISLLNNLYQHDRSTLLEIFLKNPKLSDFFNDVNSIVLVQDNLRVTIEQIQDLRDRLAEQKEQYGLARADASTLRDYQEAQRQETDQIKREKDGLLKVTKGQESKYQQLLKQTKETAAQIRNRIFQLLGGGELSFEQAYQYAKLASGATGVRTALILAVLDRESALGRNVGRCNYRTAMSPKNQEAFLKIVAELNLNPDSMQVSCPNKDGVYGGAMGPAQFIPITWQLYREEISRVTGQNPPSPWRHADAFVATALYLRDAGAANASSVSAERKAAARYYAGGNWSRYLWTYGEAVVSRAQRFQQDIDTIGA
jgi:membrane-bound lytic murein transglycosylase B/phage shock protein A